MTDKSLKSKAIKIKGKDYVTVSERVKYFNDEYPNGCIVTEIVKDSDTVFVVRAMIYPQGLKDGNPLFTGHSQAVIGDGYINKTSALENAETSAVGRALGFMGIGVVDSIASIDEINKASTPAQVNYTLKSPPLNSTAQCAKCGSSMGLSKQGKPYCLAKCWLETPKTISYDEPPLEEVNPF